MRVVHGAIEGIDDPDAVGWTGLGPALFRQEAVTGKGGPQPRNDQLLGAAIHLGDEIDPPLVPDLLGLSEVVLEECAGLARDLHGLLELALEGRAHRVGIIPWWSATPPRAPGRLREASQPLRRHHSWAHPRRAAPGIAARTTERRSRASPAAPRGSPAREARRGA